MQDKEVINILQNQLHFSSKSAEKLQIFTNALIIANKKHNLISKNTEVDIQVFCSLDMVEFNKNYTFQYRSEVKAEDLF